MDLGEGAEEEGSLQLASWQLAEAIKRGYVIPGFNLVDYVRSTWQGLSTDAKNPIRPDRPRTRFHLVNIWGEQGSAKTSFAAQLLGLAYGAYDEDKTEEEKVAAWEFCEKVTVVNRQDLITVAELVSEPNQRLKVMLLDDLNSIIPRQLAWEDRELYRYSFQLLGMIRRKTGVVLTTEPNIEMVIEAFKEVMTFEVILYPNATYKVERMCHDIHPYYRAQDKLTKIIIDDPDHGATFDPYDTPSWWWERYQDRTNVEGHCAWRKVIDRMSEMEDEAANKGGKEVLDAQVKAIRGGNGDAAIRKFRDAGFKGRQNELEQLVKLVKEEQLARLKAGDGKPE